jgi:hypothetical protein
MQIYKIGTWSQFYELILTIPNQGEIKPFNFWYYYINLKTLSVNITSIVIVGRSFHLKICPDFVQTLSKLCSNSVRTLSELCPNFVRTLSELCPNFVRTLSELCPNFVQICPNLLPHKWK